MSEHFTRDEIERLDVARGALFIGDQKAGRRAVVAGLLSKTIMPKSAGLPASVAQFAAQKELADALKKAAEHEPDASLLLGIAAIAERLAENAVNQGQSAYWTEIMGDAIGAWTELGDEPEPAPKQAIPSRAFPGMVWNPDVVSSENAPMVDAYFEAAMNAPYCSKRFHLFCRHEQNPAAPKP